MGAVNSEYHNEDCKEAIEAINRCSRDMTCVETVAEKELLETCKKFCEVFQQRDY